MNYRLPSIFNKIAPITLKILIFTPILFGTIYSLSALAQTNNPTDPQKTNQRQLITKQLAKAYFIKALESNPKYRSEPLYREVLACVFSGTVDNIFQGESVLEETIFVGRFENYLESLNTNDPKIEFQMTKCIVNSKEVEKAVANSSASNRQKSSASGAAFMDLDDLRVDINTLDGKAVRVRAVGHYMMDSLIIKKNRRDTNPIFVDVSNLPREQRRDILSRCGEATSECRVTIYGTVGEVKFQKGLIAKNIEFQ